MLVLLMEVVKIYSILFLEQSSLVLADLTENHGTVILKLPLLHG